MMTYGLQNHYQAKSQNPIVISDELKAKYPDVYTKEVIDALRALSVLNKGQKDLMDKRNKRRQDRINKKENIAFLDPESIIPGTNIKVKDARAGNFVGSPIPEKLKRQWVQITGPITKPHGADEDKIRPIAYQLLSGADGVMHDGEDAEGQIDHMSLDGQRNLKRAIHKDPMFIEVAKSVAAEMNKAYIQSGDETITDVEKQLEFTTKIFRPRGLHLDDRHIQTAEGASFSASITDVVMYVTNNYKKLREENSPIVLYLPKIQTAEEAAYWNKILSALESHLGLEKGEIKTYVLVEQVEATFQLMEIRAALAERFVGYNTGRWDYINNVGDAKSWDKHFIHPNIEEVTLQYPYMAAYEKRVMQAANTPDLNGQTVLWQGGMEANIPVGSTQGVEQGMKKALAGAERELNAGASGKWASHWKMVKKLREPWKRLFTKTNKENQLGNSADPLTYTQQDANKLFNLNKEAPRTIRGARNLISVALQYGNAFLQGHQAAALKPADFFKNDDVLFLMEDAATGEIRLSILWEWLHKNALIKNDEEKEIPFTLELFEQLLEEEYQKLLNEPNEKIVHKASKETSLPIAKEIVGAYVKEKVKMPWYIDLLNINLNNSNCQIAKSRINQYMNAFKEKGVRMTENVDLLTPKQESEFHFFKTVKV